MPPRPSTGQAYRHWSIQAHLPEENQKPNKVGVFYESIVMDSPDRQWMNLFLVLLYRDLMKGERICNFTMAQWSNQWCKGRDALKLPKAPLYMIRHIGPSDDILNKRRDKRTVQDRGGWAAPASMRRYEKTATTLTVLSKLAPRVVVHLRRCEKDLAQIPRRNILPLKY